MRHLVIGAGEVGTALAEVLDCDLRDVAPHFGTYDVLHIAFGYSPDFVADVEAYTFAHQAPHVVVHSTVPVGTCDPHHWTHSPVRGRHPHLADGIRTFTKHVAGAHADIVAKELEAAGLTTQIHDQAATTELGKLVELVSYGISIATMMRIHALCQTHGVPFDEAHTAMSATYNDGFTALGHRQFVKQVLDYTGPDIGGHCIKQAGVALIDPAFFDSLLAPLEIDTWAAR